MQKIDDLQKVLACIFLALLLTVFVLAVGYFRLDLLPFHHNQNVLVVEFVAALVCLVHQWLVHIKQSLMDTYFLSDMHHIALGFQRVFAGF
ncbi:hypothetical protein IPH67_04305 [bacterium]|nr:MAG: hypothetical protein IPH67_04305 [bacterium]